MKIDGLIPNIGPYATRDGTPNSANTKADSADKSYAIAGRKLERMDLSEVFRGRRGDKNGETKSTNDELYDLKFIFAVDKDKNVVIKLLDKNGETVKQIPAEEFIKMVKQFKETNRHLFSKRV